MKKISIGTVALFIILAMALIGLFRKTTKENYERKI